MDLKFILPDKEANAMICNHCGKDQEGSYVEIVTGKLISYNSTRVDTGTKIEKTYGQFQKMRLSFCQDCWREERRKSDELVLKFCAICFGVSLLGLVLFSRESTFLRICSLFGLLGGLIGTIYFGIKRYRTNYSQLNMDLAEPKSIFEDFKEFIPALVYQARGQVYYWKAQDWQDWMDKKGKPYDTFESKA